MALYISLGALGLSMFTYSVSRPGKDGEQSKLSMWMDSFRAQSQQSWEQRNTVRTDALEQAAADKHTFYSVEKRGIDPRMPEYVAVISAPTSELKDFAVFRTDGLLRSGENSR